MRLWRQCLSRHHAGSGLSVLSPFRIKLFDSARRPPEAIDACSAVFRQDGV